MHDEGVLVFNITALSAIYNHYPLYIMMSITKVSNSKKDRRKDVSLMSIDELLREAIDRLQKIEDIIKELKVINS